MFKNYKVLSLVVMVCAFLVSSQVAEATSFNWTQETAPSKNWYDITSSTDGTKLVATTLAYGAGENIYYSTTSGVTWATSTSIGKKTWGNVASSPDGTYVVTGVYGGYVYLSTDSGETWATSTASTIRNWEDFDISSNGQIIVGVAHNVGLFTSTTSGTTWAALTMPTSAAWQKVTMSADGTKIVAAVNGGYLYTSTDSGETWATSTGAGSDAWFSVDSSADGEVIIAGADDNTYMYMSTDGGDTWETQTDAGTYDYWNGVAVSGDGARSYGVQAYGGKIYSAHSSIPRITSLTATPSNTTAVITWTTSVSATSSVSYGITGSYGSASTSATAGTSHSLTLTNLAECTYYLYQASSTNAYATVDTTTSNFSTTGCAEVQSGGSSNSGGGGSSSNDDDEDEDEDEEESDDADEDEEESDDAEEESAATMTKMQTIIDSLISQIKALMEARGLSFSAPSAAAGMNANENASFNRDLEVGSVGDDVKMLQQYLNKNGFTVAVSGPGSMGSETTLFGAGTKVALIKFQQANGITPASGYFGPKTRAALK